MRSHPRYKMGGAELQAHLLATELASNGWRVHYVSEYADPRSKTQVEESGLTVHQLPLRRRSLAAAYYRSCCQTLATIDADIYYQRIALPHTGLVARFARTHAKRFVWASANPEDCTGARWVRAWRRQCNPLWRSGPTWVLAWLNDRLIAYGLRRADVRVVQTIEQRHLLQSNTSLDSVVIPNGLPVPVQVHKKQHPPLVAWIANMNQTKRPELFCDLAASCADLKAQFMMAGLAQGHEEVLKRVESVPSLTYLGPISLADANDLIARATILVNTSLSEGFPNTFIQSWMRRTPVVAFVDPDDEIKNRGLGYCCESLEQMNHYVRCLLQSPSRCRAIGERARSYARVQYSLSRLVEDYEQLFCQLLG